MAVDRPTFHESWYRVAGLSLRLLTSVHISRQSYRGRAWYVLEDSTSNQFSRVSPEAYFFIGLLDGRRTVSEAWRICNEKLGDAAPTQGEIIQLLGQLFTMNLLYGELPPDTETLLRRFRRRKGREVQGFLTNLLFIRIPLFDPNFLLDRWVGVVGRVFSLPGLFVWGLVLLVGGFFLIRDAGELVHQSRDVLAPENLMYLYLVLVCLKVFHEFSHAFACKTFGQQNRGGGQVHTMGVMFLVFMPVPYMDASIAWSFRSKWHRVVVGMAGIMAELLAASIAAIVWAHTSTGTVHIIAYNVIFIASVSTLLFNGNPLLRFDAYYVLSDLIEVPNLSQRSLGYLYYLVKRYLWGLRHAHSPAGTAGERWWFVFYGIASTAYRVFITLRILLFLSDRLPEALFLLVPIMAVSLLIMWVMLPLGRFLHYLLISSELARTRLRAVGSTLACGVILGIVLGLVPFHDHIRIEGVAEPVELAVIHTRAPGFVETVWSSPCSVQPEREPLVRMANPDLTSERTQLVARRQGLEARWRLAQTQEPAAVQVLLDQIAAMDERLARVDEEIESLTVHAPREGVWVAPQIDRMQGAYLPRGREIGFVGSLDRMRVRATAVQAVAALLLEEPAERVEMRIKGFPKVTFAGEIETIYPVGQRILPSQALGYSAGGDVPIDLRDPRGIRAAEHFFEIRVRPTRTELVQLLTGQRVVVRIELPSKPLAIQVWRWGRQLFQRRFHV